MYTPEQWAEYRKMQEKLEDFGDLYLDVFGSKNDSLQYVSLDDDEIGIHYEGGCMGHYEQDSDFVPIHYLWTKDWVTEHKHYLHEQRLAAEKRKEEERLEKERLTEAEERVRYLELHKKYGGEDNV